MMTSRKFLGLSALVMSISFGAGCASTEEMKRIEETANSALRTATDAQQTASDAMTAADEAKASAQDAAETTNEALRIGEEANACCAETNEKLDRAFRSSMAK